MARARSAGILGDADDGRGSRVRAPASYFVGLKQFVDRVDRAHGRVTERQARWVGKGQPPAHAAEELIERDALHQGHLRRPGAGSDD